MRVARETKLAPAPTAPNQAGTGQRHDHQGNKGLPVHISNITGNAPWAIAFFMPLFSGLNRSASAHYACRMNARLFHHPHRVLYADCTLGNHVYHARYLDLLEAARGEFFRHLGATFLHWQDRDSIFPVIEARLRYKLPAAYDDTLQTAVWVTLAERVRLNFSYRMVNQDQALILDAETFHVCTGRDGKKPKRLPAALIASLSLHLRPVG